MVWFKEYLDDAMKGENDNKDALDSLMACLYGFGTGDLFGEQKKAEAPRPIVKSLRRVLVQEGDKIIEKWV
jgi:hypothetical protein